MTMLLTSTSGNMNLSKSSLQLKQFWVHKFLTTHYSDEIHVVNMPTSYI